MTDDLIAHNPMLKAPLLAVLSVVRANPGIDRAFIDDAALDFAPEAFAKHTPPAMTDVLVRNGALREDLLVDGEEYAGTLEDVQCDETVSEDAQVEQFLAITADGEALLQKYDPVSELRSLFDERPHYAGIFREMLKACQASQGCTRAELEDVINANLEDTNLKDTEAIEEGLRRVYPQYFIDALETAEGIAWDGAWKTTEAGKAMLD